jgi:hypothetical protein
LLLLLANRPVCPQGLPFERQFPPFRTVSLAHFLLRGSGHWTWVNPPLDRLVCALRLAARRGYDDALRGGQLHLKLEHSQLQMINEF